MSQTFDQCTEVIQRLQVAVRNLDATVAAFELKKLEQREWYELLERKLKPQLGDESFLVVAVVGGTNIGKSVVFNHIAGGRISSTSPMASGTKHPTVIVPDGFTKKVDLNELFPGFVLSEWKEADQALALDDRHLLFWQENKATPQNLVILDTPDVDSVAEVNWERADHIRQSADVLIALLTQQKYNDAAVKEFFRKAAQEDKLVIVLFNQCLLPDDEQYWPLWVGTFCKETGVKPHAVYIAPNDRRAAEANELSFYERPWPISPGTAPESYDHVSRNLLNELSQLRFGEIKVRTLRGALKHLIDPQLGIPSWLHEIDKRSHEFQEAMELMGTQRLVEIERWPTLPNKVMIRQIRQWWAAQREGWQANVHGFYNRIGQVVAYPISALRGKQDESESPLELYKKQEWETVLDVLDRALERLTWMRDLGNPLLSPRLEKILSGASREGLIKRIRNEHEAIDFEKQLKKMIEKSLAGFREESPESYKMFRRIDSVAAAARPVVSVVLFVSGAGPLGDMIAPVVTDTALQGVLHVAGEAVGGTVVTAVGDKVITEGASSGAGYLEARFRQLHATFAQQRAAWMAHQLESQLFGSLPHELSESSQVSQSAEFKQMRSLTDELTKLVRQIPMTD